MKTDQPRAGEIVVEGLGKSYSLGSARRGRPSLREQLSGWFSARHRTPRAGTEPFWALRDLAFRAQPGEVVGIIGRNGAGKSTLLKLLARITRPTEGRFTYTGRLAALLEVGTGFHPELTGRENIHLNGALLGLHKSEIRARFSQIVDFAEIGAHLDSPVKRYSSGMYVRLAFAVAAHLEPDILVVDEVLAVGDVGFQTRCLGRMHELASDRGRTVLFVSHNLAAVCSLCTRALLLDQGRLIADGPAETVSNLYLQRCGLESGVQRWSGDLGDEHVRVRQAFIRSTGPSGWRTSHGLELGVELELRRPVLGLVVGWEIWALGQTQIAYTLRDDREPPPAVPVPAGWHRWVLHIPPDLLSEGHYSFRLDVGVHQIVRLTPPGSVSLDVRLENPDGIGRRYLGHGTGLLRPAWPWTHTHQEHPPLSTP